MATTAPNPNFDIILSTTLKNYRNVLADNLTGHQALLAQLRELGFIREDEGGTSIVEQLLYGKNTTVKSYSGYDVMDTTPQTGITAAEYLWKQIAGSVTISGTEEFQNQGRARLINLMEAKMLQLDESMQLEVNRMLFQDGTGNFGKDLTGLNIAVEDGVAWSTYGGIDSSVAANSFWRNQWVNFTGAGNTSFGTASGASVQGMNVMRNVWNSCARGKNKPTLIISDQALYEAYEKHGEGSKLEIQSGGAAVSLLDMGFVSQTFKRTAFVFDDDCPAQTMFFLNSNYLRFVVGKGRNFITTPFIRPKDQEAKVAQVIFYGNLTCANRARQGRIGNFVATP